MSTLLITNAALLDLRTCTVRTGSSVRVEGDRITEVALGRTLEIRAAVQEAATRRTYASRTQQR